MKYVQLLTVLYVQHTIADHTQYKLVGLANLYEIFKDKVFMDDSKNHKDFSPRKF